jgi:hypothetical protein
MVVVPLCTVKKIHPKNVLQKDRRRHSIPPANKESIAATNTRAASHLYHSVNEKGKYLTLSALLLSHGKL